MRSSAAQATEPDLLRDLLDELAGAQVLDEERVLPEAGVVGRVGEEVRVVAHLVGPEGHERLPLGQAVEVERHLLRRLAGCPSCGSRWGTASPARCASSRRSRPCGRGRSRPSPGSGRASPRRAPAGSPPWASSPRRCTRSRPRGRPGPPGSPSRAASGSRPRGARRGSRSSSGRSSPPAASARRSLDGPRSSDLEVEAPAVHPEGDEVEEDHHRHRPGERGLVGREPARVERLVEALPEAHRHAGAVRPLDGEERLGEEARAHEHRDRVPAVGHERRGPPLPAGHVHDPVGEPEERRGQAAGEQDEGRRPDALVDREEQPRGRRLAPENAERGEREPAEEEAQRRRERLAPGPHPLPEEQAQERRGDRGQGGEDALGVPRLRHAPDVGNEDDAVHLRREVRLHLQVRRVALGPGDLRHQGPVADEQTGGEHGLAARPQPALRRPGREVADADALQHPRPAHGEDGEVRVEGHQEPQADQLQRAGERRARASQPPRERERHPDHEQEEREDEVGGRPPVPGDVQERPVDVPPVAGVVDEDHRGDGRAAEDVERQEPSGARRSRGRCRPRGKSYQCWRGLGRSTWPQATGCAARRDYEAPSSSRGRFVSPRWRSGSTPRAGAGGVGGARAAAAGTARSTPHNENARSLAAPGASRFSGSKESPTRSC